MSTVAAEQALALSEEERGPALLSIPEDQWFDRKSNRTKPQELADAMIAFANAEGGLIVLGLWDGRVEGIDATPKQESTWKQACFDFTVPTIPCHFRTVDCINHAGKPDHLLVVEVETSDRVHANQRDDVYLRVGDESRRLSFAQRQELLYDKGQATFEATVATGVTVGELDSQLLDSYAEAVNHPEPMRLLKARGLMTTSDRLTVAATLLFAEHPQTWYPEAHVRVLRYRGTERGTGARQQLLEDVRIEGPIPDQLHGGREAIAGLIPTRTALVGGRFGPIGLIPEDAWLEALVNAVVHRSYSISGNHTRIEIFDDRMEIESPGRFPGIAHSSDPLTVTRFARNPRIARVCSDLAFGQELGEGIRRMFDEMRLAGLDDPVYYQTSGSVRVTLSSVPVDHELERRLPPRARLVLKTVKDAGRISTGEIVEATGSSRPIVLSQLKALREAGLVSWVGHSPKDPRAFWTVRID